MSRILLTNDDGIHAEGLRILAEVLSSQHEVWVVAPSRERSACGRSVTLHRPLRVRRDRDHWFAVDGTPTDCVLLAFRNLMPVPPEIVLSGINRGINLGEDLDYSGTVAGAAEGALQGAALSISLSLAEGAKSADVQRAAARMPAILKSFDAHPVPKGSFVNINFPLTFDSKLRWTRPAPFLGTGQVEVRVDPRGMPYYWISHRPNSPNAVAASDRRAVDDGCVSFSLLTLDRAFPGAWEPPPLEGVLA